MSIKIPTPWILDDFIGSIIILDEQWANFVETSKLTCTSGSTLKPDNQWYRSIIPFLRVTLKD
jgi:hypothetical protein